jgi:hypothetical protein
MPVEIREMVVKAMVPPQKQAAEAEEADPPHKTEEHTDQNQLVEACVAAVMRILEKKERR